MVNIFDFVEATESAVTARSEQCFDAANGFLKRTRALKSGTTRNAYDLLAVHTPDERGNLASERYYGGDTQSINTGALCSLTPPASDQYRINYEYQNLYYGDRLRASYATASNNPLTFFLIDADIDRDTGLASKSRDSAGVETIYVYDSSGRLTWEKPASGHGAYVHHQYVPWGSDYARVESCTKPNGTDTTECSPSSDSLTRSSLRFDHLGRLFLEKTLLPDASWNQRKTTYNALGWRTWVSEWYPNDTADGSMSKTLFTAFDPFGRPATITPPDGSSHNVTMAYTGVRQVARTVKVATSAGSEADATTTEQYDRQGRLYKVTEPSGSAGASVTTTYSYDAGNRLKQASTTSGTVTQTRTFTYDNRGFLTSEQLPELGATGNGSITYPRYDARGHILRRSDGASFLTFAYDRAERLTAVDEANSSWTTLRNLKTLAYATGNDGANLKKSKLETATMHNWLGATPTDLPVLETYAYAGVAGRVSSRTTTVEGRTIAQSFAWNDLGKPASVGYPDDTTLADPSRTVSFTYAKGALTTVAGYTHSVNPISYHPNFLVNQVPHANGVTVTYAKDANNLPRPASIATSGSSANWSSGALAFDGAGNLKAMGSDAFVYDKVSRLTSATFTTASCGSKSQTAAYNAFGFMTTTTTTDNGTQTFTPDASGGTNRISGVGYDAAGNVTSWGALTYLWNPLSQLETLSGTSPAHTYVYTADGERIQDREGSDPLNPTTTAMTVRDLSGKVLRVFTKSSGAWSWTKDYVHRDGLVLASVGASGTRHFHLDHLGTPRRTTDTATPTAQIVATHDYYPFGLEACGTADGERLRFTGHERDPYSTLDYMHARYYNPAGGRFAGVDLLRGSRGAPQSFNLFAYVQGNPMSFVDPFGLAPVGAGSSTITVTGQDPCPWVPKGMSCGGFVNLAAFFNESRSRQGESDPWYRAAPNPENRLMIVERGDWRSQIASLDAQDPSQLLLEELAELEGFLPYVYTYLAVATAPIAACAEAELLTGLRAGSRVAGTSLFRPGGLLNSNRYLRIGWGRHRGHFVFRLAGRAIQRIKESGHIDLWRGGRY